MITLLPVSTVLTNESEKRWCSSIGRAADL
jgi:hypothetical protein